MTIHSSTDTPSGEPAIADEGSGGARRRQPPTLDPLEAARYIGQLTAELAGIARASQLDLLAYFLDMARMEAAVRARALRREEQQEHG